MSRLIETLKAEHRQLQQLLMDAKAAGIGTDAGQVKLRKARALLLAHLDKEDRDLYPDLKRLGGEAVAQSFSQEMTDVSRAVVAFFDKYANGGKGFEFASDFGSTLGLLSGRLRREEISLYPKYDALVASASHPG